MKKGMFCLLPLLALSQVATSTPHLQVDESIVLVSAEIETMVETPITKVASKPEPLVARPVIATVPRDGRNRRVTSTRRILIRR